MKQDSLERIKEKVNTLNGAAKAYYDEDREIMPNIEYDELYDELVALEKETGIVLANSPTQRVGYEIVSELPKVAHPSPMLSLDKTKDPEDLREWVRDKKGVMSWKLDGLTVALTYNEGKLQKAVTRGDGLIGEVITPNARTFKNLPLTIAHKGELVLRGEAIIKYSDFERINEKIEDVALKYKNPRNLSSGSVRQLNSEITAKRHVHLYAFGLVRAEGVDFDDSRYNQLEFLKKQGFDVVEHFYVDRDDIIDRVHWFAEHAEGNDLPSDGLVLIFDSLSYSGTLGATSKFPRDAIAFKWADELKETVLKEVEWSASRTGLINPIAIFEPVEIEGTTVSRASVHNISILEDLKLGIGDTIRVYKANMIIPQVAENLTKSGPVAIPTTCPVCGGDAVIRDESGIKFLYCTNENCMARQIKVFSHFVSRNAINIEGLSESTLEKFIAKGFITEFADIFKLSEHKDEITAMEGFGEKSYANLVKAIETSRNTTQVRLLNALGVPNIGLANAKVIANAAKYDFKKMMGFTQNELVEIDGIGDVMAKEYVEYFANPTNLAKIKHVLEEIHFQEVKASNVPQIFAEMVFVVTGKLEKFTNRNALKEIIEARGGKVAGSVSNNTDYLINDDVESNSSKNRKAKQLGVEIIDENTFEKLLNEEGSNA